jgi:hypothetical protein
MLQQYSSIYVLEKWRTADGTKIFKRRTQQQQQQTEQQQHNSQQQATTTKHRSPLAMKTPATRPR